MGKKLAAVEQKIEGFIKERAVLKKLERKRLLTSDEQEELVSLEMLLAEARASVKRYDSYIKLAMKDEPPEAMTFKDADEEWTQSVTGVDTSHRLWTSFVVDENIHPRPGFQTAFEEICKGVHQETLRIFPELELSVTESNGAKKRKLNGRTDYTIGFGKGKDSMSKAIPREVHLVAVEAKTSIGISDLLKCVAEAATLYKIRVDARKAKKSVWGIIFNAETWRFIFIDEAGLLWKSVTFGMSLECYEESNVLQVYRIVYYIVKCCHEACTPPPSTASSVVSLSTDVSE